MKSNDIWLIDLNPTKGAEIQKIRPAIVVNNNALGCLPLKIIVPLTDWKERYSMAIWMVKIMPSNMNNLTKPSSADCFQIRSISDERFLRKVGEVESNDILRIRVSLNQVLMLDLEDNV